MRALPTLAVGLVLILLDLRINDVDLLPDPVGWLVAVLALASLAGRHLGFLIGAVAAGVGLLASLPAWVTPGGAVVGLLDTVALTTLTFATCTALMATVPAERRAAGLIRWWNLGLTGAALLLGQVGGRGTAGPALLVVALPLIVATLGVFAWFVLVLVRAGRPGVPLAPPGLER